MPAVSSPSSLTVLSAAIVFLTPLLWQLASTNPLALLPLPPLTAWLVASALWVKTRAVTWGIASGVALAIGLYTSPAAVVMMPVFVATTLAVLIHGRAVPLR